MENTLTEGALTENTLTDDMLTASEPYFIQEEQKKKCKENSRILSMWDPAEVYAKTFSAS